MTFQIVIIWNGFGCCLIFALIVYCIRNKLKGQCHEIFNTLLSTNFNWAPHDQAKTV